MFDLFDAEQRAEPFERLSHLRAQTPVSEPVPGVFFVARHDDVAAVFRNHETFSSQWLPPHLFEPDDDTEEERPVGMMDPPRHTPIRKLLLTAFNQRAVEQAEPFIEHVCRSLVSAMGDRAELMDDYARPIPAQVILHMIGVPEDDHPSARRWIDAVTIAADPSTLFLQGGTAPMHMFDDVRADIEACAHYIDAQIEARRAMPEPPDDVITRMVQTTDDDGQPFSTTVIRAQIRFAIFAGQETTRSLIGNLLHRLATEPELYARVRDDRSLVPDLVEESLRHESPVQLFFRQCVRDTELAGTKIPEGALVCVGIQSANRDEHSWQAAHRFDPDRERESRHLAFGAGIHTCVGAALARAEARWALEAFFDRFGRVELAPGFAWEKTDLFLARAPRRLDVLLST